MNESINNLTASLKSGSYLQQSAHFSHLLPSSHLISNRHLSPASAASLGSYVAPASAASLGSYVAPASAASLGSYVAPASAASLGSNLTIGSQSSEIEFGCLVSFELLLDSFSPSLKNNVAFHLLLSNYFEILIVNWLNHKLKIFFL